MERFGTYQYYRHRYDSQWRFHHESLLSLDHSRVGYLLVASKTNVLTSAYRPFASILFTRSYVSANVNRRLISDTNKLGNFEACQQKNIHQFITVRMPILILIKNVQLCWSGSAKELYSRSDTFPTVFWVVTIPYPLFALLYHSVCHSWEVPFTFFPCLPPGSHLIGLRNYS